MNFENVRVLSVDPSLRSTGYYRSDSDEWGTIKIKPKVSRVEAIRILGSEMTKIVDDARPDILLVEGYTPNSKGSQSTHSMGEARGAVFCASPGVPIVEVPIPTWKSQTIGMHRKKGNKAQTEIYLAYAGRECGRRVFGTTDEADACMIYHAVGRLLIGKPSHKVVVAFLDALKQTSLIDTTLSGGSTPKEIEGGPVTVGSYADYQIPEHPTETIIDTERELKET